MLKVLKGLTEYLDLTLGVLLEGIVLHAFEGRPAFVKDTLQVISKLKDVYGMALTASDAHALVEAGEDGRPSADALGPSAKSSSTPERRSSMPTPAADDGGLEPGHCLTRAPVFAQEPARSRSRSRSRRPQPARDARSVRV